ncbi:copper resistance D family protein [Paraburkholderia adhaesiva]|uniref:copper resistance D family protein n=1 Tax=Paraburkholderia adhaesiva TaxID=2883244 RepID=UPI001F396E88|nr:CopD family protein [Paraburkholderia adhaesiva]
MLEQARLRRWRAVLTTALSIAAFAYLWLQAAVMSGSALPAAGAALGAVLTESHFGLAWSVGFFGALVAALSCYFGRRGFPLFVIGMLAYAAGKAAFSHAADSGDFSLREAIHVVHLVATGLWAGSVIVAAILLYRLSREAGSSPGPKAAFCSALSHLATLALVVVLLTGFYNAMQDTAHASAPLFGTAWGRLLAAKLACVALATALGGWNRMVVLPDLHARAERRDPAYPAAQRRFDSLLAVEALAMLAILVLAAVLGHTSPTGG